jgi:hypothetical protein
MKKNRLKKITGVTAMLLVATLSFGQEICDNGIDDDGDGLIDLNDVTECFCDTVSLQPSSLIPNPSFEDTLCCPQGFSQVNCANGWIQASTATSDYYNLCGWSSSGFYPAAQTPLPNGGNGFVGIIVQNNWSEYIGSCLPTAMSAGISYTINFYTAYSQGDSVRTFAIYGSQDCAELPWPDVNCPTDYSSNWVLLDSVEVTYNTTDGAWQLETMTFTPTTDIQAITIGATCLDAANTPSYYYLDELTINSTVNFNSSIPVQGDFCTEDAIMYPPNIAGAASVQWYKEGIALVGQTQDSLNPETYGLGLYTVVVTDSAGNCYTISREVYDPFITVGNFSTIPPCFGLNNGTIDLQNIVGPDSLHIVALLDANGNIIEVDSVLNNGSTAFSDLPTGPYSILINGIKACLYDTSFTLDGDAINLNVNIGDLLCYDVPTGSIGVTSSNSILDSIIIRNANGVMVNAIGTNVANNLPAGQYTIDVTNDNGCVAQLIAVVDQPNEMNIIFNLTHNLCHGDALGKAKVDTVYNYGGNYNAINYIWTPNPNGTNGPGQTTNTGLVAGEYVLEVVDDNGCQYSQIYFINEPNPLAGILTVESPSYCRTAGYQSGNGLVSVITSPDSAGVGNNTYQWLNTTNGDVSNNSTFVTRTPGWMVMTIKDGNDCAFVDSIYVDSLNPQADFLVISDDFTGPAPFEGTGPIKVKFDNLSTNFYQANNPNSDTIFEWTLYNNDPITNNWFISTDYDENIDTIYDGEIVYQVCLVAKNFNDCRDTLCKDIIVHADPFLATPNVFTPGSAPNNTFFFPSAGIKTFNCSVVNRYGVEVFKFTSIDMEWDGNHFKNGNPCSEGTYFYVYGAEATNGDTYSGNGTINLIRNK